MICEVCGQHDAEVFLRRSNPGSSAEIALCPACAKARGIGTASGRLDIRIEALFEAPNAEPSGASLCPRCGLEEASLHREHRLGCAVCVETFRPGLERFQARRAEAQADIVASPAPQTAASASTREILAALERAIAAEDYERAAAIRDQLTAVTAASGVTLDSVVEGRAPVDGDVILWTRGRLERNFQDTPFPGSPAFRPGLTSSRAAGMIKMALHRECRPLSLVEAAELRLWIEEGLLSRVYASSERATLAGNPASGVYCVLEDENHLSLRQSLPGLSVDRIEDSLSRSAAALEKWYTPAFDPSLGYLAARLDDCGQGPRLWFLAHLPALSRTTVQERVFKSLLARGFALRGSYGAEPGSGGNLFEVSIEESLGPREARKLVEAAGFLVKTERQARQELLQRSPLECLDRAARALGLLKYARLLKEGESLAALSELRLAALQGLIVGANERELGEALLGMGSAHIARDRSETRLAHIAQEPLAPGQTAKNLTEDRARLTRALAARIELAEEGL